MINFYENSRQDSAQGKDNQISEADIEIQNQLGY